MIRTTYQSAISRVVSNLTADARRIEERIATDIARDAADSAPQGSTGELARGYTAEPQDGGHAVMALWRYHFTEFGTTKTPAHPHLMPAVERARASIEGIGRDELKNL